MSQIGLGVMLARLRGNEKSVEAFKRAQGKTIAKIELVANDEYREPTNFLRFTFEDGTAMDLVDDGQSCCESRYMTCDDELSDFAGATLLDAEVREGPSPEAIDQHAAECHEIEFLIVTTSKGSFTVASHNEHNGYYGGFDISVRDVAQP